MRCGLSFLLSAVLLLIGLVLVGSVATTAQNAPGASNPNSSSNPTTNLPNSPSTSAGAQTSGAGSSASSSSTKPDKSQTDAPRDSNSINADALQDEAGDSSSKDSQIDLSPPPNDAKGHPNSGAAVMNAELGGNGADVSEFHTWDPHKAAKDVEVGDFYFKLKNYRAAEDRYREALLYKDNDAVATYRLAVCLEKMDRPDDARRYYENYLKILPHGAEAEKSKKAIDRLKAAGNKSSSSNGK
jgi:tetratricopeptide (TPR) repeat protein